METVPPERSHAYGPRVHLLEDPWMLALLARIGHPATRAPEAIRLVRAAYRLLLHAAASRFPTAEREVETRMRRTTEHGVFRGRTTDPATRVVVANVLRAGNVPSLVCFEELGGVLEPEGLRMDHFQFARKADEEGHVVGVEGGLQKVGGSIADAVLLVPDPMGATGSTLEALLEEYRRRDAGRPAAILALHLMVTPEYLRRALALDERLEVFAGRLDRGLSPPDVLALRPGEAWERERGLDEHGYIVPGAGGVGEVLTNAWC